MVLEARLCRHSDVTPSFQQRFTPASGNLQFLSCGEWSIPAASSETQWIANPGQETLLFQWKNASLVEVQGEDAVYHLDPYDTLYIPLGAAFRIRSAGSGGDDARLVQASATATSRHPVFHSRFAEFSKQEHRIRRLKGKDVYLMFDVSESADKLVAGYTFFLPKQRSWPPHNHTDQEEFYFFIQGHGAMEVYESPETLSFVHSVNEGDLVTIPFLNYHPVFSQEDPLQFIWCIAGERYWVGDKNKDFMKGTADSITT
jgi:mannose-6-phosphate isomerase-like protein (cupin superfamily)